MLNRGSEWRRWEPHIHAPGTVMNNQFSGPNAWDDYLTALEQATPVIEAIAVTDYYVTDTYREVLQHRDAGRLSNTALIFPNVEVRLDVATSKGGFVNLHLFVSPEDPQHIDELQRLAAHAEAVEAARSSTDPIRMPRATFDPADPKAIGRMVSIALLAQPLIALEDIQPAYGSGVYAIYYRGEHPLYASISGSETPIYVGKADPANHDASTAREQGAKLTARLLEHAGTIGTAEAHTDQLPAHLSPIHLRDFVCRRLVCATNAQLVAEKHLIRTFWPIWNSETKACWGMSKHGDAAKTRANTSGRSIAARAGLPSARDAFEAGTPQAEAATDRSAAAIARLCVDLTVAFGLDKIALGGSIGLFSDYQIRVHTYLERSRCFFVYPLCLLFLARTVFCLGH